MATLGSPDRQPPAAKKRAPAGAWPTPDRPMAEAHVDVTPESIVVQNDKVRVLKKQKGRRHAPKGLVCDFSFSCARVVSCTDHQQQPWEAGRWGSCWAHGRGLAPRGPEEDRGCITKAVQDRGAQCHLTLLYSKESSLPIKEASSSWRGAWHSKYQHFAHGQGGALLPLHDGLERGELYMVVCTNSGACS